ncbi:Tyrosine decarboxylase [Forsythia ovata]|uniref:Tyrosine decarboxylase n=1 Tax=Forsythia ovata TaxID=205694 RepID=A0ABD1UV89_9LAMI
MLSTRFNVVGFNRMSSPATTELESIVMDWLGKMVKLPSSFLFSGSGSGVLQGLPVKPFCTHLSLQEYDPNDVLASITIDKLQNRMLCRLVDVLLCRGKKCGLEVISDSGQLEMRGYSDMQVFAMKRE